MNGLLRNLLIVDDEENIVRSLVRACRRDGYHILTANSGQEGLEILGKNDIGVIIADYRMPEMSGAKFLRKVKELYPDTIRIILSGYTDLKAITTAINEGAIYKFLTKPWDDDLLRENVKNAFTAYELSTENARLNKELMMVNDELRMANRALNKHIQLSSKRLDFNLNTLQISQDILESLPIAVLGIDENDVIAVANRKATEILRPDLASIVGQHGSEILGEQLCDMYRGVMDNENEEYKRIEIGHEGIMNVFSRKLIGKEKNHGAVLVFLPEGTVQ